MRKNIYGGIILIFLGGYLIISNIFNINFSWNFIWPIFILIPGLKFEYEYFKYKKNPGILIPGGILTIIGILFYLCAFLGYEILNVLWPTFILAPGIGMLQMFLVTKRKGLLPPVIILNGLAIIFFVEEFVNVDIWNYVIGFGFILLGFNFLVGRRNKNE
ncbi:hypothetical protein SAMN02745164_01149 [Marinitoga hydrogenitolerans DSM 16785]|uniref:DUF5668 domain-containing protein n=1 Tax=Marinitoga hydrogenitolerans (strain DSM 16785 / JCM 12826 / AT1271) TaxID=1122195 RepID=A0A1M4WC75_MARH1|nr:DUF5668 domain-containing protein [Marinitoga hydrogenitolerans]SHE78891.1 hypothetical protein SAMN02745164_01149 [Marinitoga hydrogenitolerans DSM 16785]